MAPSEKDRALEALEAALAEKGGGDPREVCREHLRELKEVDRAAYDEAVRHYEETLVPAIASGELEPLAAWTGYAQSLAERIAPGRTVAVDASGRASPHTADPDGEHLLLHLPDATSQRALIVALPARPSEAQLATCDWLVRGRQKLPDDG